MHIYNNDIAPAASHNYIWHPIANKLYSLNRWCYSLVYKKSCSQMVICAEQEQMRNKQENKIKTEGNWIKGKSREEIQNIPQNSL